MSSRKPITNLTIDRQIETDKDGNKTPTSTAKISFQISEERIEDFTLTIECNDGCEGLILFPCSKFELKSNDHATVAQKVYDANFSKTGWNVTIPRNFVGEQIEFNFKGDLEARKRQHYFEVLALMHNFKQLKSIKWNAGDDSGEIIQSTVSEPSNQECNKLRFEWVNKLVEKLKEEPPQIHPKQQATIEVLEEQFKPEKNNIAVTYVGLDDASNMMTSMKAVRGKLPEEATITMQLRRTQQHDTNADSSFIGKLAKTYVDEINTVSHDGDWVSNDLIVDTYTAQDWPVNNEEELIDYIKQRYESLKIGGLLILIYPGENQQLPFNKAPPLLNNIDGIRLKIKNELDVNASVNTNGVSTVLTLRKSSESFPTFPPTHRLTVKSVENEGPDKGSDDDTKKSTKFDVENLHELENWNDYAHAVRILGQPEPMDYPIELPVVDYLRDHLMNEALKKVLRNFVILQAHPGWGKTSTLGAVLFPESNNQKKAQEFSGYNIWAGKFDDIYDFAMSFGREGKRSIGKKTILIVDDYHKFMKDYDFEELNTKACEISDNVAALIVTCQKNPMGGDITEKSRVQKTRAECFECYDFTPNQHEDDMAQTNFINKLLTNTRCVKQDNNGKPVINESYDYALKWGVMVKQKLFSSENLESGIYSPRDAINDLLECKKLYRRKGIRDIQIFRNIFDDGDDDPMDLMVV